jgi:xanthine/uracil/vitamin C permease (AzgA family)
VRRYFDFERYGTTYRKETLAGITTFMTMAYIIIVNPAILEGAGMPRGPSICGHDPLGRGREVPAGLWVLAVLSLTFYLFYPYR